MTYKITPKRHHYAEMVSFLKEVNPKTNCYVYMNMKFFKSYTVKYHNIQQSLSCLLLLFQTPL